MAAETALTMSHDEVNLAWRDVTYDVPVKVKAKPVKQSDVNNTHANNTQPSSDGDHKRILHGLSGHVRAGQVVAVMGPSGSGKTSLIHVLGGRRESGVSGSFTLSRACRTSLDRLRSLLLRSSEVILVRLRSASATARTPDSPT